MKGHTNNPYGAPPRSIEDRLQRISENYRITASGCWEWTGPLSEWGYGQIAYNGTVYLLHRFAASLWLGIDLDSDVLVLHSCDNPPCFNPAHLYPGTDADNSRDCTDKGRQFHQRKTHCANGHPYSPENTSIKISIGKTGVGRERRCKTCHRLQAQKYRELRQCA
jgi:hypothetical protein